MIFKKEKKHQKVPVLTEYMTREKLLSFSSTPSILSLSPIPLTPAMTITPHQSPGPLCQPASPMPPQSSECLSSIYSTHSDPPTSSKSPPSTLHPFVALLSLLLTSGPFLPWLLLMSCLHWKVYKQPWPWRREHMKLHDYKKLAEEGKSRQMLIANFGKYKIFWSLCTSHMDFLHQQPTFLFLLPTPHVIDRPPEFPWASNGYVASWLEAKDRWGSSSR